MKRRIKRIPKLPLLWLLIMAVIGFTLGLFFWDRSQSSSVSKILSEAEPVFAELEKQVPKNFSDYEVKRAGWTGQRTPGSPVEVRGYDFSLSSEAIPGVWIQPRVVNGEYIETSQSIDDVWGLVQARLTAAGYRTTSSDSYARGKETCTLTEEFGGKVLELRCKSPKLEQEMAKQAKPFVDKYLQAHENVTVSDLVYGPMVVRSQNPNGPIGASKTAGYDLVEAVVGHSGDSSIALYYSYKGAWHYVTEATDEFGFSCSDIRKDPDARKAYRGQWCYEREDDQGLRILDPDGSEDCGRIACDENKQQQR